MDTFKLHIVTPEGDFFNGDVQSLNIKADQGYLTILAKHMPLVTTLEPDVATIILADGKKEQIAVSTGILNVTKEETLLIVDAVEYKNQIDIERAKRALERAKRRLASKADDIDLKRAQVSLKRAIARIKLYELK